MRLECSCCRREYRWRWCRRWWSGAGGVVPEAAAAVGIGVQACPSDSVCSTHFQSRAGAVLPKKKKQQPTARLRYAQTSTDERLPPVISPSAPVGHQPPSVKRQPPSVKRQPPSVKRQPPSVKRQPPSVKRQPPSVMRQPPSVKRQPPSVTRVQPPTSAGRPSEKATTTKSRS